VAIFVALDRYALQSSVFVGSSLLECDRATIPADLFTRHRLTMVGLQVSKRLPEYRQHRSLYPQVQQEHSLFEWRTVPVGLVGFEDTAANRTGAKLGIGFAVAWLS